jgi:hypothetical protein
MTEGTTRLHRKHGGRRGGYCLLCHPRGAQCLSRAGSGRLLSLVRETGRVGASARHFAKVVADLPRAWPGRGRAGAVQ